MLIQHSENCSSAELSAVVMKLEEIIITHSTTLHLESIWACQTNPSDLASLWRKYKHGSRAWEKAQTASCYGIALEVATE